MMEQLDKNKIASAEEKGRSIFEKFLIKRGITDYKFSEDEYSVYDVELTDKNGNKIIGEIKNRSEVYAKYDDMLIEAKKYKALKELGAKTGAMPIYINTYGDNIDKIKISDSLNNMQIPFYSQSHQRNDVGSKSMIDKLVGFITKFQVFNWK
jgi:hypothetical protein